MSQERVYPRLGRFAAGLLLSLGGCFSLSGCATYASTTRIVDGETLEGRPIEPEGYALYLSAQLSERQGALHRARQLYLDAARLDPQSPELWTRVGALGCRLKLALANRELERALNLDRWYAPAWVARARCELFRGNLNLALRYAKAGQVADPDDLESTQVLSEVYSARGDRAKARNQLEAFTLRHPASPPAAAQVDPSRVARNSSEASSTKAALTDDTLVQAILKNDLTAARTRITELGLRQSEVARVALELNRPKLATQHMTLLLEAAPHDTDLRVLALLAAHRAHDAETFSRWLSLPETFGTCSAACISDLDQLLAEFVR